MTRREKNIFYAGLAVAGLFVIAQLFPLIGGIYAERRAQIELLRDDIAREESLIENAGNWAERRSEIEARLAGMEAQVFQGGTLPLLTANIQRMVRQYANDTNIAITSTKLAETMETPGWLLVKQELSFTMDNQSNTLGFLRLLEQSRPYLGVTDFSLRRTRNQYSGTVTVIGFSRVGGSPQSAARTMSGNALAGTR
jgi:hypothetical protein